MHLLSSREPAWRLAHAFCERLYRRGGANCGTRNHARSANQRRMPEEECMALSLLLHRDGTYVVVTVDDQLFFSAFSKIPDGYELRYTPMNQERDDRFVYESGRWLSEFENYQGELEKWPADTEEYICVDAVGLRKSKPKNSK